jgi:hypothetical protein
MEAAAAGQQYCCDHSHLETIERRKGCRGRCYWRGAGFYYGSGWGVKEAEGEEAKDNFKAVVELLVAAGADLTYDDCRILLRAIECSHSEAIDVLLPLCAQHPAVVSGAALLLAIKIGSPYALIQLRAHSRLSESQCDAAMEEALNQDDLGPVHFSMLYLKRQGLVKPGERLMPGFGVPDGSGAAGS